MISSQNLAKKGNKQKTMQIIIKVATDISKIKIQPQISIS